MQLYECRLRSKGGTHIYGAVWDGSSSPTWTRTDGTILFSDPQPYYSDMSETPSSPFDGIMPWAGIKRVEDPIAGSLVEIPKYYYKWTRNGSSMKLQISEYEFDGAFVSPAHADRGDGKGERDIVYVGRYHCDERYKSTSGVKPFVGGDDYTLSTRSDFRNGIHNLGSNIWQYDYAMYWTIMMLYLVEFASWDSQTKIGYGCSPDKKQWEMGYTDLMPYHTGTTAVNRTTYGGTQYRYIEGLWDNVYDWCDGIYFSLTNIYCIKNPANFSDTTGGTLVGQRLANQKDTWITTWSNPTVDGFEYALYPNNSNGGSDTTYICDACTYSDSGDVLAIGGMHTQSPLQGAFYLRGEHTSTALTDAIGSRVMKLP